MEPGVGRVRRMVANEKRIKTQRIRGASFPIVTVALLAGLYWLGRQGAAPAEAPSGPRPDLEGATAVSEGFEYTQVVEGEPVFVLSFLQGRNPEWVGRPFFARYDAEAAWLFDLEPAFGAADFFFDPDAEYSKVTGRKIVVIG